MILKSAGGQEKWFFKKIYTPARMIVKYLYFSIPFSPPGREYRSSWVGRPTPPGWTSAGPLQSSPLRQSQGPERDCS